MTQLHIALTTLIRRMTPMRVPLPDGTSLERSAYAALFRLYHQGPQRGSELAAQFGLDLSTVSRQLTGLVRQGLVRKASDPQDGRAWLLELTAAGRQQVEQGMAARQAFFEELLAGWSESDVRTFTRLLGRFTDDLDARRCRAETAASS